MVIAGEDGNDRKALRVVLEALCPEMRGRLVEIGDSVRLKSATGSRLKERVSVLHRKAKARAARENADLACLVVHEDWDDVDGEAWAAARRRVADALVATAGRAHYALAVWEIEAWLLMFPTALTSVVSTWSVPRKYGNSDTGHLSDPKKILKSECGGRSRLYQESDAPTVLQVAADKALLDTPSGSNRSWTQLVQDIGRCCTEHLAHPRR